jgi:sec-independent protein translocase protein TatC
MEDRPLPFWDHIEEIRRRLVRILIVVVVLSVAASFWADEFIAFLARPAGRLIFIQPTEAIMVKLKVSLGLGFLLGLPYAFSEVWRFLAVGLYKKEKYFLFWILPAAWLLFLLGFSLGLFVIVPEGIKFLIGFKSPIMLPALSVDAYFNFAMSIALTLGLVFELPLLGFFLGLAGVLDLAWLKEKRRLALLICYIFAALVTPGPDPVSAFLVFLPSYLVYEASILTAAWGLKFKP